MHISFSTMSKKKSNPSFAFSTALLFPRWYVPEAKLCDPSVWNLQKDANADGCGSFLRGAVLVPMQWWTHLSFFSSQGIAACWFLSVFSLVDAIEAFGAYPSSHFWERTSSEKVDRLDSSKLPFAPWLSTTRRVLCPSIFLPLFAWRQAYVAAADL